MKPPILYIFLISTSFYLQVAFAKSDPPLPNATAPVPSLWTNSPLKINNFTYSDGTTIVPIFLRQDPNGILPSFACGFFCTPPCNAFLFSVFILSGGTVNNPQNPSSGSSSTGPRIVWAANREQPVGLNSTVELGKDGDLVLKGNANGTIVWSTGTKNMSVIGLNLTSTGNLVLFGRNNKVVWQSFDYPYDMLLLGQSLKQGNMLIASNSVTVTNLTKGQFYLTITNEGLFAYIFANPPQLYFQKKINTTALMSNPQYKNNYTTLATFTNGSFAIFANFGNVSMKITEIPLTLVSTSQYMRLEPDGHLRIYEWDRAIWKPLGDVLMMYPDDCGYPTVCGNFGICSQGQCSCPSKTGSGVPGNDAFFKQINDLQPNLGCELVLPVSCDKIKYQKLVQLDNVTYFNFPESWITDEKSCKSACLNNCSCKAVFFKYGLNSTNGSCYLPGDIFSLMNNQPTIIGYNSSTYVKVQVFHESVSLWSKVQVSVLHTLLAVLIIIVILVIYLSKKAKSRDEEEEEENLFSGVSGMPNRFSYLKLKKATNNFKKKLGQGGFGPVFDGHLGETRIAVKCLRDVAHGKEEFLAEVMTIGSIHHINLVKLIGFCSDKSHRLLVYEYMSKGSLDKWIFKRDRSVALDWRIRYKIIVDVAKGLAYLHEECRVKIAHLDIKPSNILLDDNYNARISDFGLAKLIDRDQSHVMTKVRGTRGYLAPEWLTSQITEKADVYSFGVVVLEVVSGRRNLDSTQPEGCTNLINLLQDKIKEDSLKDLIDSQSEDMLLHEAEIVEMIKLAIWCLQKESARRPHMSQVVKVLEGSMDTDTTTEYESATSGSSALVRGDIFAASPSPPSRGGLITQKSLEPISTGR
ncbi:hypothetical protein LUZ60_012462 [Juncus effusus]|nr:hypothetical protein LUZ60_012462 [Juncus effusus]